MALITRLSRLFRADFHAVIDRMEAPDILLKQAVREMEAALAQDEQRMKALHYEQRQCREREKALQSTLQTMAEELEICLASNEEDLARSLIRRQLEAEKFHVYLSHKAHSLDETLKQLGVRTEENRGHLQNMRQKAEVFSEKAANDYAENPNTSANAFAFNGAEFEASVGDDAVEVALLKAKQRRAAS